MKKNLEIVSLFALIALLCACSSQSKPSSNFEYPSLEDIHQANLEQEMEQSAMGDGSYGSIEEAHEANAYGFPLLRLHDGRFYPLERVNDRVDIQFGEDYTGYIMRDAESLAEIRLSDGDQLVSLENLGSTTLYPAQFMDCCSSVYFYNSQLSINSGTYIVDMSDASSVSLSEINGRKVEVSGRNEFFSVVSDVLREAGLRPEEITMNRTPTASVVVCGEYGDSFTAGGYSGVQYQEYHGVIDHNFYRVDTEIIMQDLLELTKDGYAIIDLSNVSSGVCFIGYFTGIYGTDTYAFRLRNE